MAKDQKLELLKSVPLFAGLGRAELEDIAALMEEVDLPAGHVLMRQGEIGNEMYVVATGKVAIDRNGKTIAERGPGASIGEMSLLAEGARTATVRTLEPSRFFVVGHREFHSLMDSHQSVRIKILEGLAEKVRALDLASAH